MNAVLTQNFPIVPSSCDSTGKLGIPDCFELFMDIATAHANILGVGRKVFDPQQLFWLVVRTKVKFFRRPEMNEEVSLSSWPEAPERFRCNRHYLLKAGEEVLARGKTQWTIIDLGSGALHPVGSVFPSDLSFPEESALEEHYSRLKDDFSAAPFASYQVRSTDIDIGGHMNNCAYLRAFASLFSCKEWNERNYTQFDVHYKSPCFEGDKLFFREGSPMEDGSIPFSASREDGKALLLLSCK